MTHRASQWLLAGLLVCPLLASAAPRLLERAAVRAELPSKPTGPIALEHRVAGEAAVGVPLTIAVTARVAADARDVRIDAAASLPRAVLVTLPALDSAGDGLFRWTITIVPLAAEAGYLNVSVSADVDGIAQADAVTISLRSAAPGVAPAASAGGGGENLIALPVQESP